MGRVRVGGQLGTGLPHSVTPEQVKADGWAKQFGRDAPLVLEIGYGNGVTLAAMAKARPEVNFVGIELYGEGMRKLSKRLVREQINNLILVKGEALALLTELFDTASLSEVHVNCPDPWPKKRHHKRRLIGPPFAVVLHDRLAPQGSLHLATDHDCYAYQMRTVMEAHPGFLNRAGCHRFLYHLPGRMKTKYELKFAALGARIRYLIYDRAGGSTGG